MSHPFLRPGSPAPAFTLMADGDRSVSLSDHRGRIVVLYFYPKDNTPGCTKEACDFRDAHVELTDLNTVVLGVSPDSVASHDRFKSKQSLPFTLLSDPDNAVARAYGVFRRKQLYGREFDGVVRSTFVIDPEGIVVYAFDNVKVHRKRRGEIVRHVDDVIAAIRELSGALTP